MALSVEEVRKIAALARLSLTPEEQAKLQDELGQVLAYVKQLEELDVSNVEPMTHATDVAAPLRADVVTPGLTTEDALASAPSHDGHCFQVPRIIE
jgi:aspartyl-tRNA(Asn)/glutamyl-tRNA(Gln) amidotransferase subunit C